MDEQEDHFRVYSDRQLDASLLSWNPYMDLMASLSSDPTNHSISVWRLIDDKQSGSPLLFSEKVPFAPTAVGWVPDKRGLTVGDATGNVFVFDAERKRTIELQKVHECAISSLHWRDGGFSIKSGSNSFKLPRILPIPLSIGDGSVGPAEPDPQVLSNDGLASTGKSTILSVLGSNGRVQLYFGGSIPVGELSIPDLFNGDDADVSFKRCELSPDLGSLAVLSEPGGRSVYLVSTGLLRLRRRELAELAMAESDIFWLMKELQTSLASVQRVLEPIFDDFSSSFGNVIGELDDELIDTIASGAAPPVFIQEVIKRELTGAKLSKISKSILSGLDFFASVLVTRIGVLVDHLALRVAEVSELSCARTKFRPLGLESADDLVKKVAEIKHFVAKLVRETQSVFVAIRVVAHWVERAVDQADDQPNSQRYSAVPERAAVERGVIYLRKSPKILTEMKNFLNFSALELLLAGLQNMYVSQLSGQRRAIGSKFTPVRSFSFPSSAPSGAADMIWDDGGAVKLVWADSDSAVTLSVVTINGDDVERLLFSSPPGSVWNLPKFYDQNQVCVLLVHDGGFASVCLLTVAGWPAGATVEPAEYGFPTFFVAQQLPAAFSLPEAMEVSASRGLCSVQAAGRVLTLDLDGDDEDNEEDSGSEKSSESSIAPPRGRNLRKHDSLVAGFENANMNASRSSSGSPEQVAQRLKFAEQ